MWRGVGRDLEANLFGSDRLSLEALAHVVNKLFVDSMRSERQFLVDDDSNNSCSLFR